MTDVENDKPFVDIKLRYCGNLGVWIAHVINDPDTCTVDLTRDGCLSRMQEKLGETIKCRVVE